jgi:hypothetical protein
MREFDLISEILPRMIGEHAVVYRVGQIEGFVCMAGIRSGIGRSHNAKHGGTGCQTSIPDEVSA